MRLNPIGRIIHDQWNGIPHRFPDVNLDEFVVMPNHIHGIFAITVGAPLAGALNNAPTPNNAGGDIRATARVAPTVGDIVGAYKSLSVHHCLKWIKHKSPNRVLGKLWQRNYWEHVVRNENELSRIREYIVNNPAQWELDRLYDLPSNTLDMVREPAPEYALEKWMV